MERAGPRMKIDEPKTPYVQGSETCSSTSGSARTSPPESPSFIPGERLVGFRSLEASMAGPGASSDGASSAGSGGRSVHICEEVGGSSGGSSPKSKEIFAARRKAHYRNEFRSVRELLARNDDDEGEDDDQEPEDDDGGEDRGGTVRDVAYALRSAVPNGHHAANGNGYTHPVVDSLASGDDPHMAPLNGHAAAPPEEEEGESAERGADERAVQSVGANGGGAPPISATNRTPGSDVAGD